MANFHLSPFAEGDLEEIYEYSHRTWGEAQARKYISELYSSFSELLDRPAGRKRDDIYLGLRSKNQGKHVIFYFESDGGVEIVNVLHGSMDPLKHLDLQG